MTKSKQIFLSFSVLVISVLFFEMTNVDVYVQNQLYDFSDHHWALVASRDGLIHFIFYDGVKRLLVAFALFIFIALLFYRHKPWVSKQLPGLIIVVLSLLIVPSVVSTLKSVTNVACPKALVNYGGEIPFVSVFEHYTKEQRPKKPQKCFPAAHASAGFSLLSLFFLGRTPRRRKQALAVALSVGWLMGGYKMLIGDHFLSHTVVSMVLAWLLINLIAVIVGKVYSLTAASRNTRYGDSMST